MTIGELYKNIETFLVDGPKSMGEIYRNAAASTDATMFDVIGAVHGLVAANRICAVRGNVITEGHRLYRLVQ